MESGNNYLKAHLIPVTQIGEPMIGYISVADHANVPFEPKRVFWTYYTPESIVRGRHAHYKTEQFMVAVAGKIIVHIEDASGHIETFVLDNPHIGLYIPPNVWHTMQYSHTAVQLVIASTDFHESDYIRDHATFLKVWNQS